MGRTIIPEIIATLVLSPIIVFSLIRALIELKRELDLYIPSGIYKLEMEE